MSGYSRPGSGGGAPIAASYYTQVAESGLSAERVLSNLGNYNPDNRPASPSATDDEFDAGSLNVAWTSEGPAALDVGTHGFVHIADSSGPVIGIYKAYVPGAAAFTVVCKMSGNVALHGSNQTLLGVSTGAGAAIVQFGMLQNNLWIAKATALGGGFTTGALWGAGDLGTHYFMIQRDAATNYSLYTSSDGIAWVLVSSFSQAGTVGRCYLQVAGQAATSAEMYADFVRMFPSQTKVIGGNP